MAGAGEIGGYLELERFCGEHYHRHALRLHCCRSALLYALELRGARRVWVPDLMCEVVPEACRRAGAEVLTYRVGEDLAPDYGTLEVRGDDYLLLADYYGQLRGEDVGRALRASGGKLVVDETQGFFRRPWEGADTLYTCRKFFGVPDGGYLATRDGAELSRELPRAESHGRMAHLLGRFEGPAGDYYGAFREADDALSGEPAMAMSALTDNLLRAIDYGAARRRRERNFAHLHERLGERNLLGLRAPEGPFAYPLLVDDAEGVREALAAEGVFVPTLWPNVLEEQPPGSVARQYAENILPLPVDQRYGEEEMERLSEVLGRCLR